MAQKIITTTRKVFERKCPRCKKIIRAFSESNLEYNFGQHVEKHERAEESGGKQR